MVTSRCSKIWPCLPLPPRSHSPALRVPAALAFPLFLQHSSVAGVSLPVLSAGTLFPQVLQGLLTCLIQRSTQMPCAQRKRPSPLCLLPSPDSLLCPAVLFAPQLPDIFYSHLFLGLLFLTATRL